MAAAILGASVSTPAAAVPLAAYLDEAVQIQGTTTPPPSRANVSLTTQARAGTAQAAPLIQQSDVTYIGAFRVPDYGGAPDSQTLAYGGTAVGFNPVNNSLFLTNLGQLSTEMSIPQIVNSSNINNLNRATTLQALKDATEGRLSQINPTDPNSKLIGSAFVYNSKLYIGAYSYYDGAVTQTTSQFVRPVNLSTLGQVLGPYTIGSTYPGWVDKNAAIIPPEWQASFGGQVFVGGAGGAINSVQSWGPSASVINPDNIGSINPVPAALVLGYPSSHPLRTTAIGNAYWAETDVVPGATFPGGTRSVIFVGTHGLGNYCYGTGGTSGDCYDPDDGSKGTHAYPYQSQVWAYDANDLVLVKNGLKQSWEIQPYAVWNLDSSFKRVQGVGFDPATRRLYVSAGFGDGASPLVRVYQITVPNTAPPPATRFYAVTPCRIVDTRGPSGPLGGPALAAGSQRAFNLTGTCGVPVLARSVSANITVVSPTTAGEFRLYPADQGVPNTTTLSFRAGQTRANNALLGLAGDVSGGVAVQAAIPSGTAHIVIDVNGYFQ